MTFFIARKRFIDEDEEIVIWWIWFTAYSPPRLCQRPRPPWRPRGSPKCYGGPCNPQKVFQLVADGSRLSIGPTITLWTTWSSQWWPDFAEYALLLPSTGHYWSLLLACTGHYWPLPGPYWPLLATTWPVATTGHFCSRALDNSRIQRVVVVFIFFYSFT